MPSGTEAAVCRSCGGRVGSGPVVCPRCGEHWPALATGSYVALYLFVVLALSWALFLAVRASALP